MGSSLDADEPSCCSIPLVVLQLGLLIFAIVDLLRDDRAVRGGNKGVWAVIIVFVSLIGPILYFLVGREDGPPAPPGTGARARCPAGAARTIRPSSSPPSSSTPHPSSPPPLAIERAARLPVDAPPAIRSRA